MSMNRISIIMRVVALRSAFLFGRLLRSKQSTGLVLIIPGDLGDPGGSFGDVAMISGLTSTVSHKYESAKFLIIGNNEDSIFIPFYGDINVTPAWLGIRGAVNFAKLLDQCQAVFGIGADVLDGKYDEWHTLKFCEYLNFSAKYKVPTSITGFSFNRNPNPASVVALANLNGNIPINVRDEFSLARFHKFVKRSGRLCADIAFLMPPDLSTPHDKVDFIELQRRKRRKLIGINLNFHALQLGNSTREIEAFTSLFSERLIKFGTDHCISIVLIPHDVKATSGDLTLLNAIFLKTSQSGFLHLDLCAAANPAMVKNLCSDLDLVITGRMHLAIAALGVGTPVLCLAYQDKFEGLLSHFGLDEHFLVQPEECLNDVLFSKALDILERNVALKRHITSYLPEVIKLANTNFS